MTLIAKISIFIIVKIDEFINKETEKYLYKQYDDGLLFCGNCLEIMKWFPDKCIDLVLTDPPYGITKAEWDIVPKKEYFDEIFRISKNQIIFGYNFFNLPPTRCWICWYKRPFLKTTAEYELIWTSFNYFPCVLNYTYAGNYEGFYGEKLKPNYEKRKVFFTSEKPLEVLKWIIRKFSNINNLILDPFLGSGTTAVACVELNRKFIGIEISEEYCKITDKRIRDAYEKKKQGELKLE